MITATTTKDHSDQGILSGAGKVLHSRENQLLTVCILLLDLVLLLGIFFILAWIRIPFLLHGQSLLFLTLPCGVLVFFLFLIDGYNPENDLISAEYASQHLIAVFFAAIATLFASFVVFQGGPLISSRPVVVLSFFFFMPGSLFYRRSIHVRIRNRMEQRTLLFIGSLEAARKFYQDYGCAKRTRNLVFATRAPIADDWIAKGKEGEPDARLRAMDQSLMAEMNGSIGAVVVADELGSLPDDLLSQLVELRFRQVRIYSLASFYEVKMRRIPSTEIGHRWLLQKGFNIAHDPVYLHFKRLSDLLLSGAGLLATAPLFPLVALAVKATDGGPVFFRQRRIGKDRIPFTVYKFRTMRIGAENGGLYTRKEDGRVTKVGRWLRKWRLDELPQLWNVFKGDMSLIGPRAEWDQLVADYEKKIPGYHFRHLVKPGITGWAQVNYPYGANLEDTIHKLEYDLYYLRHFSFLLDASIILKTVHTMIFAKGQ